MSVIACRINGLTHNLLSCVKSPQILELSGIGDPKILRAAGVAVTVDLPGVGTNVQEHVTMTEGLYSMSCTGSISKNTDDRTLFEEINEVGDHALVTSDMLKDDAFAAKIVNDQ